MTEREKIEAQLAKDLAKEFADKWEAGDPFKKKESTESEQDAKQIA